MRTWFLIVALCIYTSANTLVFPQNNAPDTIAHSLTITPFELNGSPKNFPCIQAFSAGDVNADGTTDIMFNVVTADERTEDLSDNINKSLISYLPGPANEDDVFHESEMYGIGDYNGDGYDDLIDFKQECIRYGSPKGINHDSIPLDIHDDFKTLYFKGDMNDDGFTEFILGPDYNDTIFLYSGPEPNPIPIINPFYSQWNKSYYTFYTFDYDCDDTTELCIVKSPPYSSKIAKYFRFSKSEGKLIGEQNTFLNFIQQPPNACPVADMNGDGIPDIFHNYTVWDTGNVQVTGVEVIFGDTSYPYFSQPHCITIDDTILFYAGYGDYNGDSCLDFSCFFDENRMHIYYGCPGIQDSGYRMETYTIPPSHEYASNRTSFLTYSSIHNPPFDYNNDGTTDFLLSYRSLDTNLRFDEYGTAVILGGNQIDFGSPVVYGDEYENSFAPLKYGEHASNIGDFNKDGYDDWAVLAKYACYLEIFFGGSELDHIPDVRYNLPQSNMASCFDFAFGDLNNDTWADLVISNSSDVDQANMLYLPHERNEVYIFNGSSSIKGTYYGQDADCILRDTNTFYGFGSSLNIVGDYNGDGFDDIVIGGRKHKHCLREAFVYYGGGSIGPDPDLILSIPCTQCGVTFANPITRCGDVNADGFEDFALGDLTNNGGKSWIYFGGLSADDEPDMSINNPDSTQHTFGAYSAKRPGDFNGDGVPDIFHYDQYHREILVFLGGIDFDSEADIIIHDTSLIHFSMKADYFNRVSELGRSDIAFSYSDSYLPQSNITYHFRVYSVDNIAEHKPSFVLRNDLCSPGLTWASGDFNNDGKSEIYTGLPNEWNYGFTGGGIINLYLTDISTDLPNPTQNTAFNATVFPNPTNNKAWVSIESPSKASMLIQVYDIGGRLINQKTVSTFQNNRYIYEMNTGNWQTGLYLVNIIQNNTSKSIKLLKE